MDRTINNNLAGGSAVNSISFNQCQERENYFITVDDASNFRLWDSKKGTLLHEENQVSNGTLATCAFEPIEGNLMVCGGIDGKLHVYQIVKTKREKKDNDQTLKLV